MKKSDVENLMSAPFKKNTLRDLKNLTAVSEEGVEEAKLPLWCHGGSEEHHQAAHQLNHLSVHTLVQPIHTTVFTAKMCSFKRSFS